MTTIRACTEADMRDIHGIYVESVSQLLRQHNLEPLTDGSARALDSLWETDRAIMTHLFNTAERQCIAEINGRIIGYARATLRDGVRQLTELFVHPGRQSRGVGKKLIEYVFPAEGARQRVILASSDIRGTMRYFKAGIYARFPIYYFTRRPKKVNVETDLDFQPMSASAALMKTLNHIDNTIIGYRREEDHRWFVENRQGYLYTRAGEAVGYGYVGARIGPMALLNPADYPAVLAHAETTAARQKHPFALNIPGHNRHAIDHALKRDMRTDSFIVTFMSDKVSGSYDHYIFSSPDFFT